MGWSFRKRIKVLPGVHINIGKKGISTSIGGKGGSVNLSRRGTRVTNSIPGTGISHSSFYAKPGSQRENQITPARKPSKIGASIGAVLVFLLVSAVANLFLILATTLLTGPETGSGIGYLIASLGSLYLGFTAARRHYRKALGTLQD